MDFNTLVNQLKFGETYTVTEEDNSYQVHRAPTRLHLRAAQVIEQQAAIIQQNSVTIQNLMKQIQDYVVTLEPGHGGSTQQ